MNPSKSSTIGEFTDTLVAMRAALFPWAIALAVGLDYFDNTLFSFYAVRIAGDIGAPPDEMVWASSAYAVAAVLGILQHKWWVEKIGHRSYISICLFLFAVGAFFSATCETSMQLAVARTLQGYMIGPMLGAARVLIQADFTPKERPKVTRIFLCMIVLGSAMAPLIGGVIVADGGWRAIFGCTVPAACLIGLLAWFAVPSYGQLPKSERSDPHLLHYTFFAIGMGLLQVVFQQLRFMLFSQSLLLEWGTFLAIFFVGCFIYQQWMHPQPLVHLHELKVEKFRIAMVLYAAYYFISNAMSYLSSRFLEAGLGYPVEITGYIVGMTSMSSLAVVFVYFAFAGKVKNKKFFIVPGFLIAALTCIWFMSFSPQVSRELLIPPLILRGLLLIFVVLPVANLTFRDYKPADFIHTYRLKNIVRQVTYSFSTATMIVLEQHRFALHYSRLAEISNPANLQFQVRLAALTQALFRMGHSRSEAAYMAQAVVASGIRHQATFLSIEDGFLVVMVVALFGAAFAFWQKRLH